MSETFALVIVGGGPSGMAAARGYRDAGGDGRVAIVSDEHRMPYQRPPLTKQLLRGESSEAELPLEDEDWLDERDVDLVGGHAVALDPERGRVILSGGRELPYAHCVLATGAEPVRLPIPGADRPRVRVIRTLDHLRELLARLDDDSSVVVIGSGFIGCEIASSLRKRGHAVKLVAEEPAPNAARLGEEAAGLIAGWLTDDGVQLHLEAAAQRIEINGGGVSVLTGAERVSGELAVMAVGVRPRSELAVQAGLTQHGQAIPVDAAMRSQRAGLLAAGDVCQAHNQSAGRALRVEHWGDALAQGEIAGRTAAGAPGTWSDVPGFWSTIGERTLKYAAWGDGFDASRLHRHGDGGFTAWYGRDGRVVGVLAHEADEDYERGRELIAQGAPWPS